MDNVSLTEMIKILAEELKLNYILDSRVKGAVTIHTYGEVKPVDLMPLLQTVLRVNQATIVKVGDLYRIIPIQSVSTAPMTPQVNVDPKTLPDDERMVLNLIFLKYSTATELDKLIAPFLGEGASHTVYEPANLIIVQDNSRSMRRTMELISIFDSDSFAGQRVKLFEIENSRPSDLVKELDSVFKAYALSEKSSSVKFLPVDRINILIAIAPNPGIFEQVANWIAKLDIPVKITAGAVSNYLYRVHYGRVDTIAMAIMALYSGDPFALLQLAQQQNANSYSQGLGLNPTNSGMGYGAGAGYSGYNGYGPYGNQGGVNPYGNAVSPFGRASFSPYGYPQSPAAMAQAPGQQQAPPGPQGAGRTGEYMGMSPTGQPLTQMPHIIPNPFDNTIMVQGTPQEWEQIKALLVQLDVPPRQVLIEAKIYEVDLIDDLSGGVSAYLQKIGSGDATAQGGAPPGTKLAPSRTLAAASAGGVGTFTTGLVLWKTHELLALVSAQEAKKRARVISAPSIMATDNINATMNVGSQVPTLTSSAATGLQNGGSSVFANTISNQSTGVTLNITPHVNSSGIVTLMVNQQVSAPVAPDPAAAIQSPSFSNRSISTQLTMRDGDTVAIGGVIQENHTYSTGGVPFLNRIPVVGAAFGSKNTHTDRTELIIFFTPRVIYDTPQLLDATEELKSSLKRVGRLMKDQ
jgi:general secretion pathway protein D